MFIYLILLAGFAAAAVHLYVRRQSMDQEGMATLLLKYGIAFGVGLLGVLGGLGHLFRPDEVARSIGWATGHPFQFEVGVHDLAWGVLGFLALCYGRQFWLATITGWSIFMLGAAFGHFREAWERGNVAVNNVGMIVPDLFVAAMLIALYVNYARCCLAAGGAMAPEARDRRGGAT